MRLRGDAALHQAELLRHVIEILEGQEVTYMLVGSFASAAYGEPRFGPGTSTSSSNSTSLPWTACATRSPRRILREPRGRA